MAVDAAVRESSGFFHADEALSHLISSPSHSAISPSITTCLVPPAAFSDPFSSSSFNSTYSLHRVPSSSVTASMRPMGASPPSERVHWNVKHSSPLIGSDRINSHNCTGGGSATFAPHQPQEATVSPAKSFEANTSRHIGPSPPGQVGGSFQLITNRSANYRSAIPTTPTTVSAKSPDSQYNLNTQTSLAVVSHPPHLHQQQYQHQQHQSLQQQQQQQQQQHQQQHQPPLQDPSVQLRSTNATTMATMTVTAATEENSSSEVLASTVSAVRPTPGIESLQTPHCSSAPFPQTPPLPSPFCRIACLSSHREEQRRPLSPSLSPTAVCAAPSLPLPRLCPRSSFQLFVSGEIEGAFLPRRFSEGPMFCRFSLTHGDVWQRLGGGEPVGTSAAAYARRPSRCASLFCNGDGMRRNKCLSRSTGRSGDAIKWNEDAITWNEPFEGNWMTASPVGWPRLNVCVYECPPPRVTAALQTRQEIVRGFASLHLPTQPGRHERYLRLSAPLPCPSTIVPENKSIFTKFFGFFSSSPFPSSLTISSSSSPMMSVGEVKIVFNILLKNATRLHYSF